MPKIEKKFTGIDQSNEQAPFSTWYLQLALAHARNSRVKKAFYFKRYSTPSSSREQLNNFAGEHTGSIFTVIIVTRCLVEKERYPDAN